MHANDLCWPLFSLSSPLLCFELHILKRQMCSFRGCFLLFLRFLNNSNATKAVEKPLNLIQLVGLTLLAENRDFWVSVCACEATKSDIISFLTLPLAQNAKMLPLIFAMSNICSNKDAESLLLAMLHPGSARSPSPVRRVCVCWSGLFWRLFLIKC